MLIRNDEFTLRAFKTHLKDSVVHAMVDLQNEIESIEEDFETKLKEIKDLSYGFLNKEG